MLRARQKVILGFALLAVSAGLLLFVNFKGLILKLWMPHVETAQRFDELPEGFVPIDSALDKFKNAIGEERFNEITREKDRKEQEASAESLASRVSTLLRIVLVLVGFAGLILITKGLSAANGSMQMSARIFATSGLALSVFGACLMWISNLRYSLPWHEDSVLRVGFSALVFGVGFTTWGFLSLIWPVSENVGHNYRNS